MRLAEFEYDRSDTREGAERRHQQDHEAAIVLQYGVAPDMGKPAAQHHGVDEQQIHRDEDIPADQQPRHQPQRGRQQEERHDADRNRNEGARPRIDDADRHRHFPESNKVLFEFLAHRALSRESQFFRSATNRAAARSTSPLAPKIDSAESARARRSRTRCLAPSMPSWVTKVVLPSV